MLLALVIVRVTHLIVFYWVNGIIEFLNGQ